VFREGGSGDDFGLNGAGLGRCERFVVELVFPDSVDEFDSAKQVRDMMVAA
jgi:hypothetical protein